MKHQGLDQNPFNPLYTDSGPDNERQRREEQKIFYLCILVIIFAMLFKFSIDARPNYIGQNTYALDYDYFNRTIVLDEDVTIGDYLDWIPILQNLPDYSKGLEIYLTSRPIECSTCSNRVIGLYTGDSIIILANLGNAEKELTMYHELGHHVWYTNLTQVQREVYCDIYDDYKNQTDNSKYFPTTNSKKNCEEHYAEIFSYEICDEYIRESMAVLFVNKTIEVLI